MITSSDKATASNTYTTAPDPVYDKKITCAVCGEQIKVRTVKSSAVRIDSWDTDFMCWYKDPNPLFYGVWLCPKCGYAALPAHFENITESQKKLIREKICSNWNANRTWPTHYDSDVAVQFFQLALLSALTKGAHTSEIATICLKLAWIYRIKKDSEHEQKFLKQSLDGYLSAYEKERFPIANMDEPSLSYLIGELYRRVSDNSNALTWYGKALFHPNVSTKIKDLARDQKDLINK